MSLILDEKTKQMHEMQQQQAAQITMLLNQYAGHALEGILSGYEMNIANPDDRKHVAKMAYNMAEAMIEEFMERVNKQNQ